MGSFFASFGLFSAFAARFLSSFFETFVDSKGLLRFVPYNLTSFCNILQVPRTLTETLGERFATGIALTSAPSGSSVMSMSLASPALWGRGGPHARQFPTGCSIRSMLVGYHVAAPLSRGFQDVEISNPSSDDSLCGSSSVRIQATGGFHWPS